VIGGTRYRDLRVARPTAYLAPRQFPRFAPGFIAVRVHGDPAPTERALRIIVHDVDPGVCLPLVTTMDHLVAEPLATPKLNSILLIAFAASIALLAAIGLYGLLAASVRARRFELAVRLAREAGRSRYTCRSAGDRRRGRRPCIVAPGTACGANSSQRRAARRLTSPRSTTRPSYRSIALAIVCSCMLLVPS
jgi:hypothetical protein